MEQGRGDSSEGVLEGDPGAGPGIAVLDQQRDRRGQAVLAGERVVERRASPG